MTVTDKTIYERIHYIYSRNDVEFLTVREQKAAEADKNTVWKAILDSEVEERDETGLRVRKLGRCMCFEKELGPSTIGLVTENFDPNNFDLWFMLTILNNGAIAFSETKLMESNYQYIIAEKITNIFESTLKNAARVDRWAEGKDSFVENVKFFTSRNIPVEAVLPAFPCKSSNFEKVASWTPDKGEELAVRRIIEFVLQVRKIYPPGMSFFIVSDGHVFSDCINVNDDVVDQYTAQLEELYHRVKPEGFEGVHFRGLNHCFQSSQTNLVANYLLEVEVDHYLDTALDRRTETNRKVLMLGCDDNAETLRQQIMIPKHPRLYLYRGFNKFMYEDLVNTATAQSLSRKKFKRLVSLVSFEMIRRNDAYSNLVELVFPFHLRLSIHAHHNAGPKFGIRLLDPAICTSVDHNQDEEDRLLHVPTPWHNAMFQIGEEGKYIVSASKLARQYAQDEKYTGGWDEVERCFIYREV